MTMNLISIIQELEKRNNQDRLDFIVEYLKKSAIDFQIQDYPTGVNVFTIPQKIPALGVASHFDVVPNSPGANDNGSAIAVCLELLQRNKTNTFNNIDLQVFFFDEEETGLKGSQAFVNEFGINDLIGLLNLELVGMGDRLALWPLNEGDYGQLLHCLEQVAKGLKIPTHRFDRIVTNTADHVSFREAGLTEVFTITCISEPDIAVAQHYYKALEFEVDRATLQSILRQAPLFQHYHRSTDLAIHLSEQSLQMVSNIIWDTLINMDKRCKPKV